MLIRDRIHNGCLNCIISHKIVEFKSRGMSGPGLYPIPLCPSRHQGQSWGWGSPLRLEQSCGKLLLYHPGPLSSAHFCILIKAQAGNWSYWGSESSVRKNAFPTPLCCSSMAKSEVWVKKTLRYQKHFSKKIIQRRIPLNSPRWLLHTSVQSLPLLAPGSH